MINNLQIQLITTSQIIIFLEHQEDHTFHADNLFNVETMTGNKRGNREKRYVPMQLVTPTDYKHFIKRNNSVTISSVKVEIGKPWKLDQFEPEGYLLQNNSVWSFKDRGNWATHSGNYRGNWSPYIPRNIIMRFSSLQDTVLDQMVGSGTTLIECKLLGRNGIGIDINKDAIMITLDRLNFSLPEGLVKTPTEIKTYVGDARNLNGIKSGSVDLVTTHPPYAGIISYTPKSVEGDLSQLKINEYIGAMHEVAKESFRVLKQGKHCAILIGDTRKHLHYIPISKKVLEVFLDVGFVLREDIIKLQWKTKTTREKWRGSKRKFLKIAHEHLYVFRKPEKEEKIGRLKYSSKWLNNNLISTV